MSIQDQDYADIQEDSQNISVMSRRYDVEIISRQRNVFMALSFVAMTCLACLSIKLVRLDEKVVLVPGLNQEVWVSGEGVSSSYLEEVTVMHLPMLLDLDSTSIDWKKEKIMSHVSNNKESYLKALGEYFVRVKEQYEQFSLSTHFALKKLESNPRNLTVRAHGQLVSRFGDRGFETESASYGLSYEWVGGKLLLKEFVRLSKEDLENV